MFCTNCGNTISENSQFCSKCGTPVVHDTNEPDKSAVSFDSSQNLSFPVSHSPKSGKKIAIISIVAVLVIAAITAVVLLITNSTTNKNHNEKADTNGSYVEEVENYLDYIADKNTNVRKYLSDMYFGGSFGDFYSGDDALEAHELIAKAMFEENKYGHMNYFYYGYSYEYDTWKDYIKESSIDDFYRDMDRNYDDWELNYEIVDATKLSDSETEDAEDTWEDVIKHYKSLYKQLDFSRKDKRAFGDFIDSIEELDVKSAYEIEVDIEIDGDDDSYNETSEFTVAKIGGEWVILDGPSFHDFF